MACPLGYCQLSLRLDDCHPHCCKHSRLRVAISSFSNGLETTFNRTFYLLPSIHFRSLWRRCFTALLSCVSRYLANIAVYSILLGKPSFRILMLLETSVRAALFFLWEHLLKIPKEFLWQNKVQSVLLWHVYTHKIIMMNASWSTVKVRTNEKKS